MKIKDVNPYLQTQTAEVKKAGKGERTAQGSEKQAEKIKTTREDRIELRGSQIVERAKARVREMPEVREERVEALKRQIESGSYNVPPEQVARAMLSDLLKDIF